jgi:hypothetical protein
MILHPEAEQVRQSLSRLVNQGVEKAMVEAIAALSRRLQ